MPRHLTAILVILLFACTQARAKEPATFQGWQAQITPYVWMSGLSGDVSATQAPPVFSVDKSFSDILEDLNGAFFVNGFAHNGRFAVLVDLNYVSTTENDPSPIPGFSSIKGDVEQISGMLAAGVRIGQTPAGAALDVLAGARAWHVDATLTGTNGGTVSESDTWAFVDPLVALRGRLPLTERLSVTGYGDLGGFGVGSDFTWQAVATLNYALTQRLFVSAGYRHLEVDYQDGGQLLDIELSGPLLGATVKF